MAETNECKKRIAVFGATGSIGSAVVHELSRQGAHVHAIARNLAKLKGLARTRPRVSIHRFDVTDFERIPSLTRELVSPQGSHGMVYAVGYGPPRGFDTEAGTPLSRMDAGTLLVELMRHVTGFHAAVRAILPILNPGAQIVAIGSAITRLTDSACPEWLHAGHYATAKAAQREYVLWLRRDPEIRKKLIQVHHISPGAVDTPFHEGSPHRPEKLLSVQEVVSVVLHALHGTELMDGLLLAE